MSERERERSRAREQLRWRCSACLCAQPECQGMSFRRENALQYGTHTTRTGILLPELFPLTWQPWPPPPVRGKTMVVSFQDKYEKIAIYRRLHESPTLGPSIVSLNTNKASAAPPPLRDSNTPQVSAGQGARCGCRDHRARGHHHHQYTRRLPSRGPSAMTMRIIRTNKNVDNNA